MLIDWFKSKKRLLSEIAILKKDIATTKTRIDTIEQVVQLKPSYKVINGRIELV